VPTAAIMNAHVRDNLNALKDPPQDKAENWNVALSTTSTSFVNMTGVEVTITTVGGRLLIGFTISSSASGGTGGNYTAWEITIDGVAVSSHADGVAKLIGTVSVPVSVVYLSAALTAGAHTVRVQWRTNNAARTISASKFQLWAREA
jgi:hypothetical protein